MRRRDFTIGLLVAATAQSVRAEERAKQHRIAIVVPAGPVARIDEPGSRLWQPFWEELRRLGNVEGQNLTVERYSGDGRPEGYADLAREVGSGNPDAIVASSNAVVQAVRAATGTTPIIGALVYPIRAGFATSLAHPGGNLTGVTVQAGSEIWGKRLQILKEAVPSASKVAFLDLRTYWEESAQSLREPSRQLQISLIGTLLAEANARPSFGACSLRLPRIGRTRSSCDAYLTAHHQLIVELVNKSRLPAMYPWRDYAEAGSLMAYGADLGEVGRRMADDVHEILNGTKPGDIPVYQPTKYELVINLNAARALGLTISPTLLARADEVIE